MTGDGDALGAHVDGLPRQQAHQLLQLVGQVRAAHTRDGVDGRVDGLLQVELVLLQLEMSQYEALLATNVKSAKTWKSLAAMINMDKQRYGRTDM